MKAPSRPSPTSPALLRCPTGAWRRRLLVRADGTADATTSVTWLQGPTLYVDLRQPDGSRAAQEGFAGRLVEDGDAVVWQHLVDLQPSPGVDGGRLVWDGDDALIEHGRDEAYVEHWDRRPDGSGPAAAVHLRGADGRDAFLVRCGAWSAWATSREVTIAVLDADGRWRTRRSTRPGAPAAGVVLLPGGRARTAQADGDADWEVLALECDAADLPAWDEASR